MALCIGCPWVSKKEVLYVGYTEKMAADFCGYGQAFPGWAQTHGGCIRELEREQADLDEWNKKVMLVRMEVIPEDGCPACFSQSRYIPYDDLYPV
jgi:hypothetical protein